MTIVSERIDLAIDNASLFESIKPLLMKLPPVVRSAAISGWAIQATNGSYQDGWSHDFCPYNGPGNSGPMWIPETDYESALSPIQNYVLETEIQSAEIKSLLYRLSELGLQPRKARIIKLSKNSSSQWHIDGSARFYQVRLHIPLLTNDKCFFETEEGRIHMAMNGGAYLVHINKKHRIINDGDEDRYHFVVNIWDTKHISDHHKYFPELNEGQSIHPKNVEY